MTEDQERPEGFATHGAAEEVAVAERRVDAAVVRSGGRQMAREAFARRRVANDNRQPLKRPRD